MPRRMNPSASPPEMEASTRVVDLSRAILEVLNKESNVRSTAYEILDWLSREKIDKQEYQYCIEALKALVWPNEKGLDIRNRVQSSEEKIISISGLKMKLSTSIGRWMLNDANFVYVVTTVATCMLYHKMEYAVDVLCNMATDQGGHEKGVKYGYSIYRTRLKPVVAKFVESVALNVVNAGHDFRFVLPEALNSLCSHPLTAKTFSAVIMAISRAESDIVITSDCFPGDLATWLLTHVHGTLEISVNGKVVFEQPMGMDERRVIFIIYNKCSCRGRARDLGDPTRHIRVSTRVGESLTTLIDDGYCFDPNPQSSARQKLYESKMIWDWQGGNLRPKEIVEVRMAAKSIVTWLLSLNIQADPSRLGFLVKRDVSRDRSKNKNIEEQCSSLRTIESLLARYPAIMHKNWGDIGDLKHRTIYVEPEPPLRGEQSEDEDDEWISPRVSRAVADIFGCFPAATSVFEMVQERCECNSCRQRKATGLGKVGCLREAALDELLLLISHGIADCFGAQDASGLWDKTNVRAALCTILTDIIEERILRWDNWFRLVALVYLGSGLTESNTDRTEGSTALAAIQRGSLVIAAAWLNLNSNLSGCPLFQAEFCEGQLCGVCGDEATVETERMMRVSEKSPPPEGEMQILETGEDGLLDGGGCFVETALIGAEGRPYRLLTMVRSSYHRRIVDPVDAIMGFYRSRYPVCTHAKPRKPYQVQTSGTNLVFVSFDDLLATWSPEMEDLIDKDEEIVEVTKILDGNVKFNVAVSLSPDGAIVTTECCLECALAQSGARSGTWNIINKDAYAMVVSQASRVVAVSE